MAGFFGQTGAYRTPGYGSGLPMGVPQSGLDTSLPADPYGGQRVDPTEQQYQAMLAQASPPPGFFGRSTGGNILGTALGGALDGLARWGGADPGFARTMDESRKTQDALRNSIILARARSIFHDDDPAIIKALRASGIDPTSQQGQAIVKANAVRPIFGDGTYIDPAAMGQTPQAPAVGTVEDGHVFLGGDPSIPTNWRKQ